MAYDSYMITLFYVGKSNYNLGFSYLAGSCYSMSIYITLTANQNRLKPRRWGNMYKYICKYYNKQKCTS